MSIKVLTVVIFVQPQPDKLGQGLKRYELLLYKLVLLFISDG